MRFSKFTEAVEDIAAPWTWKLVQAGADAANDDRRYRSSELFELESFFSSKMLERDGNK